MLINSVAGQECRIATLKDHVLEELYVERTSSASRVGNIYKGRVTNIEPSIQAAFVDFGLYKNGFLHISDLSSEYFPKGKSSGHETVGRKHPHRDRPPIQNCLKRGQEVVVQMTKEGIGTKGPTMTTYLSIPGRLLVMMPGMRRLGVSRKVEDEEIRAKTKEALSQLPLPPGMGFIVRTAGVDRPKREMQRDLNYLLRLWESTSKLIETAKPPVELYQESNLVIRTLRDAYSSDIKRIVCDDPEVAVSAREFLRVATPRAKTSIEVYTGRGGLFHDTGLDEEIDKINSRRVELHSGGSLVIDPTEALVAIDVNSGRSRGHKDAETTALKTNLEAAREIGRQLRMRDLGGVVVIDFIDMRDEKHRRAVEKELKEVMKGDRAKNRILRINSFGILQMTRQRLGPSLKSSYYRDCPQCDGMGMVKSEESQALVVMRMLHRASVSDDVATIDIKCAPQVAHYLANYQRKTIGRIEETTRKTIIITADREMTGDDVRVECTNARGSTVSSEAQVTGKKKHRKIETAKLEQFLADQAKETKETKETKEPKETVQEKDPADDAAEKKPATKKRRRRKRSTAKKTDEDKQKTAKAQKPAGKKKTDKPSKAPKAVEKQAAKTAKKTEKKAVKKGPGKTTEKKAVKKTSKRRRRGRTATRKTKSPATPPERKITEDQMPEVITPAQMREEIEARQQELQNGKPPKKTLLEAMGFDDSPDSP